MEDKEEFLSTWPVRRIKDEESRLSKYSLVIRGIWRLDTVWHSMRK